MSNTFLNQLIERILDDKDVPLHDVAVILPNRRARRLLLQNLHQANGCKPMFAPQIFPMEEFVAWLSPLKEIDQVTQLLRLHELTREFSGERFTTHQLLTWGVAFLKDISDMDMQLQDVSACLREYAEAAKFEIPFGKEEMSESDREKIQFNVLLADIYLKYKGMLNNNGEAYEGMMYRDSAENIAEYARRLPFKRLIFAGFYALSPAELEIIRYFKEHFLTEIYFDIDPFYCRMEKEAGLPDYERNTSFFIHRDCERLKLDPKKLSFNEPHFARTPKEVKIVSTSKNMRQIYGAIREVERIKKEKAEMLKLDLSDEQTIVDMSDTVVALADENLLMPFLMSCQPKNMRVNATMGFPFESTPVSSALQIVMAIYESVFALTPEGAAELMFSGEDVERLWDHELLKAEKPDNIYFPTVLHHSQLPHKEVFGNIPIPIVARRLPTLLRQFCTYGDSLTSEPLYKALWQEADSKLADLQTLFDDHFGDDEPVDYAFAKFSVLKALHNVSISMKVDPDKGLQVMGLLETRMMDFKNVIILSVNEGILPKGITYNSLLPFDFKYKFDGKEALPNYLYQDQVYAYHFFRLLQRAENVMLVYNSFSDVTMAEKSRLIAQLEYEVTAQHLEETIAITHQNLDFSLSLPERTSLSIPKSDDVMKLLHGFKFSASSLQTYIACPLRFYFQYLMRIRETPVLSDHLEAYEIGTIIHALYKQAFDELIPEPNRAKYKAILQRHIDSVEADICCEIRKLEGRKTLTDRDLEQGYWLINRRIIRETVCKYLERAQSELPESPWMIMANEMGVDITDYPVAPVDGSSPFHIRLTGSLDRVQHIGRDVMVIDYKTGKVEQSHLKLTLKKEAGGDEKAMAAEVDKLFTDSKYDKLFQLTLYVLMYEKCAKEKPTSVQVGIISTREVNQDHPIYLFQGSLFGNTDLLQHKHLISERLNLLFCELFDKSTPFTQTSDKETCKYCDFLHLCGRQTSTENRV